MTLTSARWRMPNHVKGQKSRTPANPLYRHDVEQHGGDPQKFVFRILAKEITPTLYLDKFREHQ